MSLLNMDSERFEFEATLDEFEGENSGTCSECGSDLELEEHEGHCSKCDSEFEFDKVKMNLDESELEEEIKRGKRRFRRPSGRRSRPSRQLSSRVKKRPPTKPRRPRRALRPKLKRRRHKPGKRPILIRPRRRRPVVIREPAAPCVCPAHGTEFVRWVQSSLNQVSGSQIRVNGVMNRATCDALRVFQKREGLPVDGIAGPETERALIDAKAGRSGQVVTSTQSESLDVFDFDVEELDEARLDDEQFLGSFWQFSTSPNIVDRTAFSPKDKRKKVRNIDEVYALVLHQTGFSRGNDPKKYNKVTAHFVILPNGSILQLHPLTAYLYASNGFNKGSVAVEFVGNFPSTRGKCYKPERFGCNKISQEQIEAGRKLINYLIKKIRLTHILAHRQSSGSRGNDPGPDLWYHVGQWAVNQLGLNDGGSNFKINSGKSVPDSWRNWKR